MGSPQIAVGHEFRGGRILLPTEGVWCAALNLTQLGLQPSRARQEFEEFVSKAGVLKPVLPDQGFPRRRISGNRGLIGIEKVFDKYEVVRKALVRVKIQAKIHHWPATYDVSEVPLQFRAFELGYGVPGQLLELTISLVAQIKASKFVVPGFVREARDRHPVDFFLLCAEPILIQKLR